MIDSRHSSRLGLKSARTTVVVVDDHEDTRDMMREVLEHAGLPTRCFATAQAALDALEEEPSRVVLTDLGLPGMSGSDLARAVRSRHDRRIALVAITGQVDPTPEIEHVFDAYLRKPVDLTALPDLVQALDNARVLRELATR
jgi:CheY-like chemotaxis protein